MQSARLNQKQEILLFELLEIRRVFFCPLDSKSWQSVACLPKHHLRGTFRRAPQMRTRQTAGSQLRRKL